MSAPISEPRWDDGGETDAEYYARMTESLAETRPHVETRPDGSTIEVLPDLSRVWTRLDGSRWYSSYLAAGYGPWIKEPITALPAQTCTSCGVEHPGELCAAYETDMFGGAA